jgi:HlyD family secretion protein
MKTSANSPFHQALSRAAAFAAMLAAGFTASCRKEETGRLPGYVEGEFVYVAAPLAGQLEKLSVERGRTVKPGDELFTLEHAAEHAARDGAARRVEQSQATLTDLTKGSRPSEIESLEASLTRVKAAMDFSAREVARQEKLAASRAGSVDDLERARSDDQQNRAQAAQIEADLVTAKLGSRADRITAAEADVKSQQAALDQADWSLRQKTQAAPAAGLIFDTLYRQGEWVAAGRPVVALLPPANVKVRVWVPQAQLSALHAGGTAQVWVDGVPAAAKARISFISPQAEYAPPVIYSQEIREKFTFLVELRFDDATATTLHPGQPVDVKFDP